MNVWIDAFLCDWCDQIYETLEIYYTGERISIMLRKQKTNHRFYSEHDFQLNFYQKSQRQDDFLR